MHYTDRSVSDWQSLPVSISDIRYDGAAARALVRIEPSIWGYGSESPPCAGGGWYAPRAPYDHIRVRISGPDYSTPASADVPSASDRRHRDVQTGASWGERGVFFRPTATISVAA